MNQPTLFLESIRRGRDNNYNNCCIMQFAQDVISGKRPYVLRGVTENGCTPCDKCRKFIDDILAQGVGDYGSYLIIDR